MRRWAWDEPDTAEHTPLDASHSGVRAPRRASVPTQRFENGGCFIGSMPLDALAIEFAPIVDLETGKTVAYEVVAGLRTDGAVDPVALYAYASSERTFAELGRAIRRIAMRDGGGKLLYLPLHPFELHERLIVQPDDPIFGYESGVRLQLAQPLLTGVARHVLDELRSRSDAELVIDDFGAGPATLKQLVELEPYAVKLDRELISGLDRHARKQAIVRGTTEICRELDARVVAKGVDCEAEAIAARACGVRYAQGYVVGEPAPLPAISIWPPAE
jgi:EAL domain-containing protein (putative c-di-GMP-specific phosphodiesterase class I)